MSLVFLRPEEITPSMSEPVLQFGTHVSADNIVAAAMQQLSDNYKYAVFKPGNASATPLFRTTDNAPILLAFDAWACHHTKICRALGISIDKFSPLSRYEIVKRLGDYLRPRLSNKDSEDLADFRKRFTDIWEPATLLRYQNSWKESGFLESIIVCAVEDAKRVIAGQIREVVRGVEEEEAVRDVFRTAEDEAPVFRMDKDLMVKILHQMNVVSALPKAAIRSDGVVLELYRVTKTVYPKYPEIVQVSNKLDSGDNLQRLKDLAKSLSE